MGPVTDYPYTPASHFLELAGDITIANQISKKNNPGILKKTIASSSQIHSLTKLQRCIIIPLFLHCVKNTL